MRVRHIGAAALIAGLIVYGSLAPFDWYDGAAPNPLRYVLSRWDTPAQSPAGWLINLALYWPLGAAIGLAAGPRAGFWQRLAIAGPLGGLLCFSIELIQVYDFGRKATLTDVYLNVAGTLLGSATIGHLVRRLYRPAAVLGQPAVLGLLAVFIATELYPLVPTFVLGAYDRALATLWQTPAIGPTTLLAALLRWVLAAALLARLFGTRDGRLAWQLLALGMFIGQIVVGGVRPAISEWSAVIGLAVPLASHAVTERLPRIALCLLIPGQILLAALAGHAAGSPAGPPVLAWLYLVGGTVWLWHRCGLSSRGRGLAGISLYLALVGLAGLVGAGSTG